MLAAGTRAFAILSSTKKRIYKNDMTEIIDRLKIVHTFGINL